MLEKRVADGSHFRAFSTSRGAVRATDRDVLEFAAGSVRLEQDEWLKRASVVRILWQIVEEGAEPDFIAWRDISEMFRTSQ